MLPLDQNPHIRKPTVIIGALAFLVLTVIIIINAGFVSNNIHDTRNFRPFLSMEMLWLLTVALGTFGGIMFQPRQFIVMGISGALAAVVMTGFTLLYISWRSTLLSIEFLFPLLVALFAGRGIYLFLRLIFPEKKKT